MENEYKTKKQSFTGITSKIEDDIKDIESKNDKLRTDVYALDTKIQINKFKNEIIELKVSRLS